MKSKSVSGYSPGSRENLERFRQGCRQWDRGDTSRAFSSFLAGARAGDSSSQLNLGYFYDRGLGVVASQEKALHWYLRAWKQGNASAAANIATIHRDRGSMRRAIRWFGLALRHGNTDSALDLGEVYLQLGADSKAIPLLMKAHRARRVTPATRERAKALLDRLKSSNERNSRPAKGRKRSHVLQRSRPKPPG